MLLLQPMVKVAVQAVVAVVMASRLALVVRLQEVIQTLAEQAKRAAIYAAAVVGVRLLRVQQEPHLVTVGLALRLRILTQT